jgi:hypothetical protein
MALPEGLARAACHSASSNLVTDCGMRQPFRRTCAARQCATYPGAACTAGRRFGSRHAWTSDRARPWRPRLSPSAGSRQSQPTVHNDGLTGLRQGRIPRSVPLAGRGAHSGSPAVSKRAGPSPRPPCGPALHRHRPCDRRSPTGLRLRPRFCGPPGALCWPGRRHPRCCALRCVEVRHLHPFGGALSLAWCRAVRGPEPATAVRWRGGARLP